MAARSSTIVSDPQPVSRPAAIDAVPFAPPAIGAEEMDAVADVLRSGWLTTGPRARAFEEAFAAYVGEAEAIALNSCTAALHLALLAEQIGPGDEVITTPLTFCATANTIVHTGATPVFVDVDPWTANIDPAAVDAAVTPRTRAIVAVHYGGRPADVTALRRIAIRHGLALIEDAAHAVEAISDAGKTGSTGDYTCFSFYATKNLTTGEGGMLTTPDRHRAAWIRTASLHGITRDAWARYGPGGNAQYQVTLAGFKYNMPDLQAAIGLAQLAKLDRHLARREAIWRQYETAFRDLPLTLPLVAAPQTRHARHLFTVGVHTDSTGVDRDTLAGRLHDRGIATSVHFTALHLQPFYRDRLGLRRGAFPNAEAISDSTLSLPLSAALTDTQVERVIDAVHDAIPGGMR